MILMSDRWRWTIEDVEDLGEKRVGDDEFPAVVGALEKRRVIEALTGIVADVAHMPWVKLVRFAFYTSAS